MGAQGKAHEKHPLRTCAGWYFEQPTTWQLRKIRDTAHLMGDLDNKSMLITEIMLEFKAIQGLLDAERHKAEARAAAAKERQHGSTR